MDDTNTAGLVERLLETEELNCCDRYINRDGPEAAATIAAQAAEIARLREAFGEG